MKIRIGAGTIITFVLVLIFGGYSLIRQRQQEKIPTIVERTVHGNTANSVSPVPEFLLRHKMELSLSSSQIQRIEKIAVAYRKDIEPYQQQIKKATVEYDSRIKLRQQQKKLSLKELQQASAEVQRLSAIMVTSRQAYWQKSSSVLTAQQRLQLTDLVKKAGLADLK